MQTEQAPHDEAIRTDSPVRRDRIDSIDVLRGVAVLGILPMNMVSFAMPEASMFSMKALDPLFPYEGLNRLVHNLTSLVFDMKMMSIFSMLFGVGVLLFAGKARSPEELTIVRGRWFRRCAWMLLLGMLHAYLIWHGDILVMYALCGLILIWWVRRLSPLVLATLGAAGILIGAALWVPLGMLMTLAPDDAGMGDIVPTAADLADKVAIFQSGWVEIFHARIAIAFMSQLFYIPIGFWTTSGLMMLGMALYKWGVLTGERSPGWYARMALICYLIGLPVVAIGLHLRERYTGDAAMLMTLGMLPNLLAAPVVAMGHIALIMFVITRGLLERVRRVLASVGRAAFSNYIFQSVAATTVFYGYGLGLYGRLDRPQQWLVVLAIWTVQIVLTMLWLRAFRFGPLEWVWRCLTYWRIMPIRSEHATPGHA